MILVRVIASLSPGFWRVVVGPDAGVLDRGSQQDWPARWVPAAARRPDGEFYVSQFIGGVPQIAADQREARKQI
jgi:hypothetical protein